MIANTISRIIVRVSRWSSTGNAAARPESRLASFCREIVDLRAGGFSCARELGLRLALCG